MTDNDAICERHIRPLAPIATGVSPYLANLRPYSAVLFDVYGTLLISGAGESGLTNLGIAAMRGLHGMLKHNMIDRQPQELMDAVDRAIRACHRNGMQSGVDFPEIDIVQIWQEVLGWDDVDRLRTFALEVELMVNPVYPMPGLKELLASCRNRSVRMGIVSNAQFYTKVLLEWFFRGTVESQGFDRQLLFFSWKEGHAKPSAFMFERAKVILEEKGIPAKDVLYVGNDMRNDVLPAASVGFNTALFAGDRRSLRPRDADDGCGPRRPDLIVTDLRQLIR